MKQENFQILSGKEVQKLPIEAFQYVIENFWHETFKDSQFNSETIFNKIGTSCIEAYCKIQKQKFPEGYIAKFENTSEINRKELYLFFLYQNIHKYRNELHSLFVAQKDNKIIGMTGYELLLNSKNPFSKSKHGEISLTSVIKNERGEGVSKKMREHMLEEIAFKNPHISVITQSSNPIIQNEYYNSNLWEELPMEEYFNIWNSPKILRTTLTDQNKAFIIQNKVLQENFNKKTQ